MQGLCVFGFSLETRHVWKAYTSWSKVHYTLRLKHVEATTAVTTIVACFLTKYWGASSASVDALMRAKGDVERRRTVIKLPSESPSTTGDAIHESRVQVSASKTLTLVTISDVPLTFIWSREPPVFSGDLRIYVDQPLQQRPNLSWLRMHLLEPSDEFRQNVFFTTNSSTLLRRLAVTKERMASQHSHSSNGPLLTQLMWLFCVLFTCMVEDAKHFVIRTAEEIHRMVSLAKHKNRVPAMDADLVIGAARTQLSFGMESQVSASSTGVFDHPRTATSVIGTR